VAPLKNRVERLENELRFRAWVAFERFLEGLSKEQLEDVATHWRFPDPLPEPLPLGASRLDTLSRKELVELWRDCEREIGKVRFVRARDAAGINSIRIGYFIRRSQRFRNADRHFYFTLNSMALPNFFLSFLARPNATMT
jgi:hypothetical protein